MAYNKDCAHSGPWRCVDPMPHHASSWPSTPTATARVMSNAQFLRLTNRPYCRAGRPDVLLAEDAPILLRATRFRAAAGRPEAGRLPTVEASTHGHRTARQGDKS